MALWQANAIRDALLAADPELEVEISVVRTKGDRITDAPLSRIGDRGLFTKEVDGAVLEGGADIAVHSLKDLPTRITTGLTLVAVTAREDPRDVLIGPPGSTVALDTLPPGARVGTSSLRRRAQLLATRPDLRVEDLRGNLNTRFDRLEAGDYDAILLAAAGVIRLGMAERIAEYLEPERWLPAVGQGALAVVARADDARTAERLSTLHDVPTGCAVAAERALLRELEGGCQIPIGALAEVDGDDLRLTAFVSSLDGKRLLRHQRTGKVAEAEEIGRLAAAALREQGADAILAEIRSQEAVPPTAP